MATILVVDDERAITELLSDLLSDEGHVVLVCHDGASALLAIQAQPPDLLILDVGLPVMTGDTVLRTLRTQGYADLPIIISTAGTNPDRHLADGATAILAKPFALDQVVTLVNRLLEQRAVGQRRSG
ncbi:MAG: response regulator transcription factor [Oscillochloridaceae bacterium umkhey_bin13]